MAKSHLRAVQQAQWAQALATRLRDALADAAAFVAAHGDNDFSDINGGDYVTLDAAGNISGLDFSPSDYLNVVNAAVQLNAFAHGDANAAQGDYASVLGRVARARG